MNPVKTAARLNIKFIVKLRWKTEDIIATFRKVYGGNSPRQISNLQMDEWYKKKSRGGRDDEE